ncbi:MAG TPA: hypothetical protein PKA05_14395, partial [Roseiflexaceae bacterium]|nr:hypothetical protein [Roseiflexaceae bacterium]
MTTRIQLLLVVIPAVALFLAACGVAAVPQATMVPTATTAPTATLPPTAVPTATAIPTPTPPPLAERIFVAGVDIGGLTYEEARTRLEQELTPLLRPLDIRAGDRQFTLRAEDINLTIAIDEMLATAASRTAGARIPLDLAYDADLLQQQLHALRNNVRIPAELEVITATNSISRSFVLRGGADIDLAEAERLIDERLRAPGAPRRITLTLSAGAAGDDRPTPAALQQQLDAMAEAWPGVAGVYVYDLQSRQPIAAVHERTVFNAASTIKTVIMLHAYANLDTFSPAH